MLDKCLLLILFIMALFFPRLHTHCFLIKSHCPINIRCWLQPPPGHRGRLDQLDNPVIPHTESSIPTDWLNFSWAASLLYNMMTSSNRDIFPRYWSFARGINRSPASDAELWCFFICAWINDWVNNRESGDLKCHHAHYDATVMNTCLMF